MLKQPALLLVMFVAVSTSEVATAHQAGDTGASAARLLTIALFVAVGIYAIGLGRLWSRHRYGGVARREATYFFIGMTVLIAALAPPFDRLADAAFSLHMVQHELLMLIAAPCLVIAQPLAPYLHAAPRSWRRPLARVLYASTVSMVFAWLARPLPAWTLNALALWLWHAPLLFNAAIDNTFIHVLQHASFFAAAVIYWSSVLPNRHGTSLATSVVSLFATAVHNSALGALLTFASSPLYDYKIGAFGLSALEDQQLGGLVMWVPAGFVFLYAGLLASARLLHAEEKKESVAS